MKYVSWDDSLSVNNFIIDNQHKELFRLINDFYKNIEKNTGKFALSRAISDLESYTQTHFISEENIMKNADYPYLEEHIKQHQGYIAKVQELRERFESGGLILSLEVTGFVKEWINNHIQVSDQKYKEFI